MLQIRSEGGIMESNHYDIAFNIRRLREHKGITMEKLAELAGVSANHIAKVESGNRNLSMQSYTNILRALNVMPVFINLENVGEIEDDLHHFISIINDCNRSEIEFILATAGSIKDNLAKAGFPGNQNKVKSN